MDHRTLRRIVTLARVLSFTKAAHELGISQSVLSRSVQAFERQARVRLFDRDRSGVHLTPVGRAFADRAAALLREEDDLNRMLERASGGADGDIAIGMAPLSVSACLPAVLGGQPARALQKQVYLAIRPPRDLLRLLINEEIEILICAEGALPQEAPITGSFLGLFPLSLLVRAGHPLLAEGAISMDQIYPVYSGARFDESAAFPPYFRKYLRGAPQFVIEDYETLADLTKRSDGIWISSKFAAADAVADGRLIEIQPPAGESLGHVRLMAYGLERRSISPAAHQIKQKLRTRLHALWQRIEPDM